MSQVSPTRYYRSLMTLIGLALALLFAFSELRLSTWHSLLPFFEWMETTPFGVIGKTWGAAFAVVEAFHLLAMALLGGSVLAADMYLLGLIFNDTASQPFLDRAHKLFVIGLIVLMLTGIFMACGVALKIYYLPIYWYKMLALGLGTLFVFAIKRPLLKRPLEDIRPGIRRLLAITSLMIWFSVAATGRWIGFSG